MRMLLLLLTSLWLAPTHAQETPEDREYREYMETRAAAANGTCHLNCGSTLATCQASGNLRCSRAHQECTDACDATKNKSVLSKQEVRLKICQQRCDLSGAACTEAGPNSSQDCDRGRKQCYERCAP